MSSSPIVSPTPGRRFETDLLTPDQRATVDELLRQARLAHTQGQEARCYDLVAQTRNYLGLAPL